MLLYMSVNLPFNWERFLIRGDILFDYMIHNFDKFFDGDVIKHFHIGYGTYTMVPYGDDLYEMYGSDIQKELVPWIRNEFESTQLFEKTNWKPFRDQECLTQMYLGYKKMFRYKQYYFQLAIDKHCFDCTYCEDAMRNNNIESLEDMKHIELKLYGWTSDTSEKLQPDDIVVIPPDNIMPNTYWKRM